MENKNSGNVWNSIIMILLTLVFGVLAFYYMSTTFWNKAVTITDNKINMNTTIINYQNNNRFRDCLDGCYFAFNGIAGSSNTIAIGNFDKKRDCILYCGDDINS